MSNAVDKAKAQLDAHVREVVRWHFSSDTGTPCWIDWARQHGINAVERVKCFDDLKVFGHFDEQWLRNLPHESWIPRAFAGKPFKVFETGGTTGMPKQRLSWQDHEVDYMQFSQMLDGLFADSFPIGGNWLMLGPTGPRRLRLAIEHLANLRGGTCYFIDLDPRWVKMLLAEQHRGEAKRYLDHVVEQATAILRHRDVKCLFATPRLLEALDAKISIPVAGIRGVFCGGTSMTPQVIRFLAEEVLDGKVALVPTYGNTLMGLAIAKPVNADDGYALTYFSPQPRAVLRVVDPDAPDQLVEYGQFGRIELTTLTKEFFMPRLLERDEAIRREPWRQFAWDGVGDVRPLGSSECQTVEGVY